MSGERRDKDVTETLRTYAHLWPNDERAVQAVATHLWATPPRDLADPLVRDLAAAAMSFGAAPGSMAATIDARSCPSAVASRSLALSRARNLRGDQPRTSESTR